MKNYYEKYLHNTLKDAEYLGKMAKLEGKLEVLESLYDIISKANRQDDEVDYTEIIDVIDCFYEREILEMDSLKAERYKED